LTVEAPPRLPPQVAVGPLARLLPVMVLVAAGGMVAVYLASGGPATRSPIHLFFPAMMLTSALGTLVYGARGAHHAGQLDADRQRYLRYLDTVDDEALAAARAQRAALFRCHPDPAALWTVAATPHMWERRPGDPAFGVLRVGLGDRLLTPALCPPPPNPDEADPVTVAAVRDLVRRRAVVPGAPTTVALPTGVLAVDGDDPRALVRAMVCELAVFHGPDLVAIAAVVDRETAADWDWLKWLPHHQDPRRSDAAGPLRRSYPDVGAALADAGPARTVVVVDAPALADSTDWSAFEHTGVTAIVVGAAPGTHRVRAGPDVGLSRAQALGCARRLARHADTAAHRAHGWPGLIGIDELSSPCLWNSNAPRRIQPVPIGTGADGTPVRLDINEAALDGMGPHGLCVGATGSGKSEFLRTLALGMVALHPPTALNLVLIDFKGGATFLGFEKVHHVAAVITNLADEAHLVERMNDALTGELHRRQELLRAAGPFANIGEYEAARARGATLPPLPVLFVMVDEFSELLSQHPDFAALFVAIGRLGRSLGIHLLLASQRLDEGRLRGLESHLSYRICLKTFSPAESRSVIGVPDAYDLPASPGAAYLRTADGALLRFQTATVSEPVPAGVAAPSAPVRFTAAPVGRAGGAETCRSVLETVLDGLAGRGPAAHPVWLAPLSGSPTLDMLPTAENGLRVPIGVVDKPFEQRRDPLVVDLSGAAGNVAVVGAPRSGKSTTLCTLLLALAECNDPAELGFYCLDFGGGALSALRGLPHVGAVATRSDPELCRRTVAVVESLLRTRERQRSGRPDGSDPFGAVFLVIDGWATLRQEFDLLETAVTAIAAQGLSYGIHVVLAASRWAELRPALKDQIATRIELRLGDPAESEMDRRRAARLADRPAGRGITAAGHELAIALPRRDSRRPADDPAGLADAVDRLRRRWPDRAAPPIELLPERIEHAELIRRHGPASEILLGLAEHDLRPVALDFADHPHLLVLGDTGCGKTATLRHLCREIVRARSPAAARLEIIDFRRTLLGVVESDHLGDYLMSAPMLAARLPHILERLTARMPGQGVTQQQLRARSWWSGPDCYLVIDDYDLIAGGGTNPLAALADLLPHARDIGLHVIVARRSGGAARAMYDPVLARLRELGCAGLMMSAGADEGVLLGSVRPAPLPPGRGVLITRGGEQLVQVAWSDPP
jgi:S-DNA-T family DNA segregation ATPase FtsK/SpoIIIE